jgi:hypothetical protein
MKKTHRNLALISLALALLVSWLLWRANRGEPTAATDISEPAISGRLHYHRVRAGYPDVVHVYDGPTDTCVFYVDECRCERVENWR